MTYLLRENEKGRMLKYVFNVQKCSRMKAWGVEVHSVTQL